MRLADFILANVEPILAEWEAFARTIVPGAKMGTLALRDHAEDILRATVVDMNSSQSPVERSEKSKGRSGAPDPPSDLEQASTFHAVGRLGSGFDLLDVVSEYRALRASVLRLWQESRPSPDDRDVEDVTRFNDAIDRSLTKAVSSYTQRVDQSRDMYLAILGHDLRNPLNSITMSAALIRRLGQPDLDAAGFATQIVANAQQMGRMIGDLLDYTRTRLGAGMPVCPEPMDLAELARALFDEFISAHPDRKFRFDCADSLAGNWDADRLRQAMSNLMGNAVQHGDNSGPVELRLSGDDAEVTIVVHNSGPAIPPGELARIFDPLVRGSSAEHPVKNRPGSIGLGLFIAREVARSHGGDIAVSSTAATGTSFTVRLPRRTRIEEGHPILDTKQIQKM